MERDKKIRAEVHAALDDCLAYVEELPSLRQDILRKAKGEIIVKKKISLGLIFAIVLLLAAVTALAIAHFNEYAGKIADMEAENGYYDTWSPDDRIELIRMLAESGALPEDDRVKTLLAGNLDGAAASAMATEIILDWGLVREDAITLISILEKVKGPMGHWSPEDKAWYTELIREKGMLNADAHLAPYPIMPTGEGLSQAQAQEIAFDAIAEAYHFDPAELATYKVGAEYYTIPSLNSPAKWKIDFYPPDPDGGHTQYSAYFAVIDPDTGEVVADPDAYYKTPAQQVAEMSITPEQQRERSALYDTKGHHFYWTHQERATYLPDEFALPDPASISEEEAARIAWEITESHEQIIPEKLDGYELVAMYCRESSYRSSITTAPYWLMVLVDEDPNAGPYGTIYGEISIILDANSGALLGTFGFGDAYIFKKIPD